MTEENFCYKDALAKHVNGILKNELYLDQTFASEEEPKRVTKNAIKL
jgi:putative transposase